MTLLCTSNQLDKIMQMKVKIHSCYIVCSVKVFLNANTTTEFLYLNGASRS